jgi:hypothetical protein
MKESVCGGHGDGEDERGAGHDPLVIASKEPVGREYGQARSERERVGDLDGRVQRNGRLDAAIP